MRDFLVLKEKSSYHVIGFAFILVLLGSFLHFAQKHQLPSPILIFSGLGLVFFALISFYQVFRALSQRNWILRINSSTITINSGNYLNSAKGSISFSRNDLQDISILEEEEEAVRKINNRRIRTIERKTYLILKVDPKDLVTEEIPKRKSSSRIRIGFLFRPLKIDGEHIYIEIDGPHSKTTPSHQILIKNLNSLGLFPQKVRMPYDKQDV